jgi:hypothetical protein
MARLNIAMLAQEGQQETQAVEQQTELDVIGQQAEDAIAEAAQYREEIEQTQQAIDDTEEVVQEVEEERQVLQNSQQQGGAEPVAMEALQRAVKRFEKRTGVACSVGAMGLESFSSKASRMQSTSIALEGAVEYIKKLIKMLTEAMAAVWEKVKAFFEKIMVGAERLAKRAKQVEAAAKAAQGKTAAADAKVTTGSVLAFARKENKVVEGKAFADQYVKQTSQGFVSRKELAKEVDSLIKGDDFRAIITAAKVPDNTKQLSQAILAVASVDGGKEQEGLITDSMASPLLGDYVATFTAFSKNATWEQISAGYTKLKSTLSMAENAKPDLAKEVSPLSPEDARKVASHAAGHMISYSDMRKQQQDLDAGLKKVLAEAKKIETEKDAPVDQLRVATGALRSAVNMAIQGMVADRSYDVSLTKAALDYAAASVKLAGGKGSTATGS